jgi:hypothetical protein
MSPIKIKTVYFKSGNRMTIGYEDKKKDSILEEIMLLPGTGCIMLVLRHKGEKFKTMHPLSSVDSMELL